MTRERLNTEEKEKIQTLGASGMSPGRIGKIIGRARHTVEKHLSQPDVQQKVENEKAALAERYREEARRILDSITDTDIEKASLQQKSISSGVLLDKSLLLGGDLPSVDVRILLACVAEVKAERAREDGPQLPPATEQ